MRRVFELLIGHFLEVAHGSHQVVPVGAQGGGMFGFVHGFGHFFKPFDQTFALIAHYLPTK